MDKQFFLFHFPHFIYMPSDLDRDIQSSKFFMAYLVHQRIYNIQTPKIKPNHFLIGFKWLGIVCTWYKKEMWAKGEMRKKLIFKAHENIYLLSDDYRFCVINKQ